MKIKYPLAKETINEEDIDALCSWLKSYPRLTKGQLTWDVEEEWAKFIGSKYAVFNNSGSSANLLMIYTAIMCGKIKNKKIVVPSVGWVTTISPAIQFGLEPIMCGADPKTFGIDLDQLEKICEKERPDAVIYVQVLGVPHHRERLLALKEKYGFFLMEDACAALGASYNDGQMVGTISDMSSFSFYFGHQLSTIEGGMVNTSDPELYEMLLMLRSHGWGKDLPQESYNSLVEENDVDDFGDGEGHDGVFGSLATSLGPLHFGLGLTRLSAEREDSILGVMSSSSCQDGVASLQNILTSEFQQADIHLAYASCNYNRSC